MVEHAAVNRGVVGSSPTRGVFSEEEMRLRGQEVKTSPFHGGNTGSIPVGVIIELIQGIEPRFSRKRKRSLAAALKRLNSRRSHHCADVAQLAEQLICNQQVIGSSPIIGFKTRTRFGEFFVL